MNPHYGTDNEWSTAPSQTFAFNPGTGTGGATLYMQQGFNATGQQAVETLGDTLYVMVDDTSRTQALGSGTVFELLVHQATADYLFKLTYTGSSKTLTEFKKSPGVVSPTNPDGTLHLTDPPWTALSSGEVALANASGAIGFGTTPFTSTGAHQMAEFQISINTPGLAGLLTPGTPGFLSVAYGAPGTPDPPISSAIFTLNPDGTTTIAPVLGPNGDPVLQPQDVAPEPGTLLLSGLGGMLALGAYALRRSRRA